MKAYALLTVPALLALGTLPACSSKTQQDPGLVGDGTNAASAAPDTNPDGVAYPQDAIGTRARRGSTAGDRIENFKFLGYPDANSSNGLQPISLAQYFDPTGNRYRLVHIQAAGVWCSACQAETEIVVPLKAQLDSRKVVWLVSLAEGPTYGVASVQQDLDGWIKQYKSPYTHWLDPSNANLGPFYDRTALPWNANIDAKTMEILTSSTGTATTSTDLLAEIDDAIKSANDTTVKVQ